MTSTIPTPSRPITSPPTTALPPIPNSKPRKSLPAPSSGETSRLQAPSPVPSKLRSPSSSSKSATPAIQPSNSINNINNAYKRSPSLGRTPGSPEKSVRRTVSIAAFPQPPKTGGRPSLPANASSVSNVPAPSTKSPTKPVTPSNTLRSKKKSPRIDTAATSQFTKGSKTPSLLNGSGDGKSIPSSSQRNSQGQNSIISPTASRSSSTQDSYSTSATTYDDCDDGVRRGREGPEETSSSKKRLSSKAKEGKGNVIVSVRVRPDSATSDASKPEGEWLVDGRSSLVSYRGKEGGDYFYDNVFSTHDNNAKVYDSSAKRLVRRVMEGYHGTVFAYGMTGTGKTFSMQGTASSPGVIPLAITDIFSYIRETPHREFLLRVSYLEIYNEKIHDLLSVPASGGIGPGASQQEEIKLREDSKRGVYATPLKEEIVQSPTQLLRVIARGDHSRRTSSTQFNARSSRSHAVVQIVVESRERAPAASTAQEKRSALAPGGVRVSTLSLIDLAGSERAADNKERRTEGAHINKSLLTLGTVIARLTGEKDSSSSKSGGAAERDGKHLPYRDSKLTRLLQPALSGNSLVSILCTIQIGPGGSAAASHSHTGETMNTLKFAARAKNNIVSHAKRADESLGSGNGDAGSRVLLERYRMEIQTLRSQLDNQAKSPSNPEPEVKLDEIVPDKEGDSRHEEQMLEMQLARTALKERIEHLNRLILCSKSTGVNASLPGVSPFGLAEASRSLRSSVSHSTLGASSLNRSASIASIRSSVSTAAGSQIARHTSFGHNEEEEDTMGEFGDGVASLQVQVNSLQADLSDKNRYISTLERRLLQARRSSHSRVSMGLNHVKNSGGAASGGTSGSPPSTSSNDPDIATALRDKDVEIADLRLQLDDKDRMVAALRSAARQRDLAFITGGPAASRSDAAPTPPPSHPPPPVGTEFKSTNPRHQSSESNSSSHVSGTGLGSPVRLLSPVKLAEKEKEKEKKKKGVDEMSRMLDEMIQDRVESGHILKSSRGSMRLVSSGSGTSTTPATGPVTGTGTGTGTANSADTGPVASASNGVNNRSLPRQNSADSHGSSLSTFVKNTVPESVAEVPSA